MFASQISWKQHYKLEGKYEMEHCLGSILCSCHIFLIPPLTSTTHGESPEFHESTSQGVSYCRCPLSPCPFPSTIKSRIVSSRLRQTRPTQPSTLWCRTLEWRKIRAECSNPTMPLTYRGKSIPWTLLDTSENP